jgi:hypothetical protein
MMHRIVVLCVIFSLAITACGGAGSQTVPSVARPLPSPSSMFSPSPSMMPEAPAAMVVHSSGGAMTRWPGGSQSTVVQLR